MIWFAVKYYRSRRRSAPEMISGVRASSIRIEIDFDDDREVVIRLNERLDVELHVVAKIVEAEFVVGYRK
jgi:hypothetical protein